MKSIWVISGESESHDKLYEAKQHLISAPRAELKRNYSGGGYIYHVVDNVLVAGVAFTCKANGALHFAKVESARHN